MLTSVAQPTTDSESRPRTSATVALATVAALLAGGRWASYLGYGVLPVYLADVGLATAVGALLLEGKRRQTSWMPPSVLTPVTVLVVWALVRAVTDGAFTLGALRTLAPFLYGGFAYFGAKAAAHHPRATRRWLLIAMTTRVWLTTVALLAPELVARLPEIAPRITILQPRADLDGAVAVVVALYAVLSRYGTRSKWLVLTAFAGAVNVAALSASRAPLVAAVFTFVVVAKLRTRHGARRRDRRLLVGLIAVLLAAALLTGGTTRLLGDSATRLGDLVSKVVGGEGLTQDGTSRARVLAWSTVLDYSAEDVARTLVGVAFEEDFLERSGAKTYLQDNDDSGRVLLSPHNYLIGVLARLGLVGVFLVGNLLARLLVSYRKCARARRPPEVHDLALISVLVVFTFFVVSLLGVVLEGPAGAVPFFYCAGILLWIGSRQATPPRFGEPAGAPTQA